MTNTNTNTIKAVATEKEMNFLLTKEAQFEKMKKSEKFALAIKVLETVELEGSELTVELLNEFLEKEIIMNDNRNAKRSENKKLSKTQLENAEIVKSIVEYMATQEKALSSATILDNLEVEYSSTQKATALLKQAMETGQVVKADKKVKEDGKTRVGYIHVDFAEGENEAE